MTVLFGILLTWAVLHVEYRIYRDACPRTTPTEGGESHRSEMRPSVSQ